MCALLRERLCCEKENLQILCLISATFSFIRAVVGSTPHCSFKLGREERRDVIGIRRGEQRRWIGVGVRREETHMRGVRQKIAERRRREQRGGGENRKGLE